MVINQRSLTLADYLVVFYFFLAVFTPALPYVSSKFIVLIISLSICAIDAVERKTLILHKKIIMGVLAFVPFLLVFYILQVYHYASDIYHRSVYMRELVLTSRTVIYGIIFCITFSIIIRRRDYTLSDIFKLFTLTGILQLLCVAVAFFFPSFREAIFSMNIKYSGSQVLANAYTNFTNNRGYGLSSNLFDSFGYLISILIFFTFLKGISERDYKYMVLSLIMLIMPLMNARTGVLLSIISFCVVFSFYFQPRKIIRYVFVGVLVLIVACNTLPKLPMWDWILTGYNQTKLLVVEHDMSSGVYSQIFKADIVIPPHIWLGMGGSPESLSSFSGIDSGYIQCLWRYGIIGSILFLFAYFLLFVIACWKTERRIRCLGTGIVLIFIVYLFKLFSLSNFGSVFLIFGLFSSIVSCRPPKKELFADVTHVPHSHCSYVNLSTF